MPRRPRRQLSINVDAKVTGLERSFEESGDVFHRDGMWIDAEGVSMQRENADSDSARPKLVYEDLQIGQVVGQGSSSVVLEATYGSCAIALKVINMFERAKRDQLIREIQSLYDCRCPAIIGFYGAFFREGAISVALEFMNGGSLANVISHVRHPL